MQDIIDILSSFEFLTELVFASVGIIFGILIYIIDQRGNRRQEEALDIILDQVSKVNQFQTRSLVLAINTLENELNDIKKTVTNNQEILKTTIIASNSKQNLLSAGNESNQSLGKHQSFGETISKKFTEVITDQVNNLLGGLNENLEELKQSSSRETYKRKKGLEFDLKSILRNLEGLEQLKIEVEPKKTPEYEEEITVDKNSEENYLDKNVIEPEIADQNITQEHMMKISQNIQEKLGEFEERMESIKSVKDLETIISSVTDIFGKDIMNANEKPDKTKKKRTRVYPKKE